ncbi:MAG: caspase family protein [Gemmataceae bacterium]|nr:caspase family protein [Gemmataceae bacterium]
MSYSRVVFAVVAVIAVGVGPAAAQPDPNLRPTYGSVKLRAGFLPDPFTKDVVAGGNLRTNLGGVNAFVAKAPDFSLYYEKGQFPLIFYVQSVADTTLLINLPNGTWVADDDSGGGLNPLVRIANPQSGRYDIFVGTFGKNPAPATLFISELDPNKQPQPPPVVPPPIGKDNLPACYIVAAGVDNYPHANRLRGCLNDARNTVAAFKSQTGAIFRKVEEQILLDATATRANIHQRLQAFTQKGAARDFMVLFLSGHGSRTADNKNWFFLPFDFHPGNTNATILSDRAVLDLGDQLVKQKKHFVVIVDACFSGQLVTTAQSYLNRYQTTGDGGMILMMSSAPHQTSAALGNFSAFAKAFADAMAGNGDLNRDGKVTLEEIKTYTARRTAQLLAQARISDKQDCIVAWSPSISRDLPLAISGRVVALEPKKAAPADKATRWVGSETLPGYGKLAFALYPDGRAVMIDARDTSEGVWRQENDQYTLLFGNGSVVYTGTRQGNTISGKATSPSTRQRNIQSWDWTVQLQAGG